MRGSLRPVWTLLACVGAAGIVSATTAACIGSSLRGGSLEPRYVAVHNALRAMGMAEVGPLHDGRLGEGQEAKIALELEAGCTTLVAIGGGTIADLDAALVNGAGSRVARAASHSSDATIRACVPASGSYALVVKSMHGSGDFIVSSWAGGAPSELGGSPGHPGESSLARGTCDAPFALSAGDFTGSTSRGESHNVSKTCTNSRARELVYKLDLASRQKVIVTVENDGFDSVLYMRKGSCTDQEAEVACNDDSPDKEHSKLDEVVDPGTYYVFVDGYNEEKDGSFKMKVELVDVPALAQLCQSAPQLAEGTPSSGTTEGTFDEANATCGDDAKGPDTVYSFELDRKSRVRLVEQSDDFNPVIHVRSDCVDAATAVGCADSGMTDHEAAYLGILDPGTYAVFADANRREAEGKFTVTAETAPEQGSGVHGERCGDAIPLSKTELVVNGDTFAAKDDIAGTCGGTGAPDVVYRLDVTARTKLDAKITREEGTHVLSLLRGCTGPKAEIVCGKSVDQLLVPGTYFLAVDGDSPASFGKFTFEWSAHDTRALDAACHAPPLLPVDHVVSGTTSNAQDKYTPSCVDHSEPAGAPDVVYKVVLPSHAHVRFVLTTSGWGSVLSLRKSCVDGDAAASSPGGEVECRAEDAQGVRLDATLDAGTYYVVVDGREAGNSGAFTLQYHVITSGSAAPAQVPPQVRVPRAVP
jgi:hypothetical protein